MKAAPTSYAIAFELGVYAVAAVVLFVLWRARRRREIALMLSAMAFAGALELSVIGATHSYYYARFLVMLGPEPDWFPLSIAVAWGLVLHTAISATARLELSLFSRALVAAPLGTLVDLVLDPVVANARVVAQMGELCNGPELPHGSAVGLGLWVWCVPDGASNLIWGIPFANFFSWGVICFVYAGIATGLRGAFGSDEDDSGFELGHAIATALLAFCLVYTVLQLYAPIVERGVPEWSLLALVFAPGTLLLLRPGSARTGEPILLASWIFPPAALLYCLIVYVVSGTAEHTGAAMIAFVAIATLVCLAAHAWVLLGPWFFWQLLGQYRAAREVRSQPTRAQLLGAEFERVSQQDLAQIVALPEPVLRNYMITQRYHDLSLELARVVAGPNANWCTFATWASKTAGESIRGEEVPRVVTEVLRGEERLERMLGELGRAIGGVPLELGPLGIFDLARDTLTRVRSQVADGNRKVFAELAPLFASLIACFDDKGRVDPAAFDGLLASLRPGPSDQGGQEPLRQAFSAYVSASQEPDMHKKAEWMLLGNCLIGLHEQTRLQPNIEAAINAPVDTVATEGLLARAIALLPDEIRREFEQLFGPGSQAMLGVARAIWQHIATAAAMHISLPDDQRIPLGADVNDTLAKAFPADLRTLDLDPLRALLQRFGVDHAVPFDLGATDWSSLHDRMRFIIDLFRTTQAEVRLLQQPFTPVLRLENDARFAAATARALRPDRASQPVP